MPLVSAPNLAPIFTDDERRVRARLGSLRHAGWIECMSVGMTEARQQRWFVTNQAAQALYAHDGVHATRDGDRPPTPFSDRLPVNAPTSERREHLPWTATSRGVRTCVRRLAALEPLYRLAPGLLHSGWLRVPDSDTADRLDIGMTDFRLLRYGGWFHAVAHYGEHYWVTFTYVGLHATERALRRKRAHRFWGLDAYASEHDAHERAVDRVFYGDPEYEATPSAQVMLAADSWAAHLAQCEFARGARPLICTPDGLWGDPVELRPSGDRVDDPVTPMEAGRAEQLGRWRRINADTVAITDSLTYATFMAVAQFPAMRRGELSRLLSASQRSVSDALARLVEVGLIDRFDGRCYLTERGLRRAANVSRLLASALIRRHGAYLLPAFRHRQRHHDDGVNQLVLQFAAEGAAAFVGWRGEINVLGVTQIRPDLVVLVADGPLGAGAHCLEYERSATTPSEVIEKIRTYRKCAAVGRHVPLLMVCETEQAAERFAEFDTLVPLLVTHMAAVEAGRLTGDSTVWRKRDTAAVSLRCV
ncbi:replication-relaxation family protein [Candidatus Poriferisodalis sp.]|uniref:replication-relaxation family protein n=1 Tax=Candidatus Poriferisodalis sp. TaxID=3101277 RepID=UPI003B021146